jgi:hypothetical protein
MEKVQTDNKHLFQALYESSRDAINMCENEPYYTEDPRGMSFYALMKDNLNLWERALKAWD